MQFAPSTYYATRDRSPSARSVSDEACKSEIPRVHESDCDGVDGAKKIWKQLNREKVPIAYCTVRRVMKSEGPSGARRGRQFKLTTISDENQHRPSNLVDRRFVASAPNRLWVADLTYVKTHTGWAYRAPPLIRPTSVRFVPVVMSGRDGDAAARVASDCGIDEWTTDWRQLVDCSDVDVVDICTPPGTRAEIARVAAAVGKAIMCEKPLATNYADAAAARDAAQAVGVHHAIGFNYRCLPALALMAQMVARGELGEIHLWRGTWLSAEFVDSDVPFDWRFEATMGGTTIADLISHLIDLATWMLGAVDEVAATSTTFVRERFTGATTRPDEVDDASSALLRFSSGAQETMEVSRSAPRRPCDFVVEVNGSRGTAMFSYAQLNELWFASVDDDPRL